METRYDSRESFERERWSHAPGAGHLLDVGEMAIILAVRELFRGGCSQIRFVEFIPEGYRSEFGHIREHCWQFDKLGYVVARDGKGPKLGHTMEEAAMWIHRALSFQNGHIIRLRVDNLQADPLTAKADQA